MAAEVSGSLKPLEFKGIIEILQRTCLRHNRARAAAFRRHRLSREPLLPVLIPSCPGEVEALLQLLGELVLPCILSLCPKLHLGTALKHGEGVWRRRDSCMWMNVLGTFEPLFLVTLFKHFYIVTGPFIPSFSILLNSVLLVYICF